VDCVLSRRLNVCRRLSAQPISRAPTPSQQNEGLIFDRYWLLQPFVPSTTAFPLVPYVVHFLSEQEASNLGK
jgi:hypothetical protein